MIPVLFLEEQRMEHVTQRKLYKRMTIVVKTSIDEKSKGKRS